MGIERRGMGRKEPSRTDGNIFDEENRQDTEHLLNPAEFWEEMVGELDKVIADYFPKTAVDFFQPPNKNRLREDYKESKRKFSSQNSKLHTSQAFAAAAAIRYVDDFIDEALWQDLPNYNKDDIESKYAEFLEKAHAIASRYDKTIPHELVSLPKLELHLYLNPDQETFDTNIEELVRLKSLDLHYINTVIRGQKYNRKDLNESVYMSGAIEDYGRDFMDNSWETDTDFNLFSHIVENNLDPQKLEDLVLSNLSELDSGLAYYARNRSYGSMSRWASQHLPAKTSFVERASAILYGLDNYRNQAA